MTRSMTNGNAAEYFVDRHVREGRSDKTAFIETGGRTISYGELAQQSDCIADLFACHGISREDRVAMLVLDTLEFPTIFWGALKAGVVPVCMNTLLATDVYRVMLEDSRAKALFVSAALYPLIEPLLEAAPHLSMVFFIGDEPPAGTHSFADELTKSSQQKMLECIGDEVRLLALFLRLDRHAQGCAPCPHQPDGNLALWPGVLGIHEDDTIFSAAKLFFAYGLGNGMTFPMAVGATTILLAERPTPQAVFERAGDHQADDLLRRADALCRHAGASRAETGRARFVSCADASRPARPCRRRSASLGRRHRHATFSMASARPNCCTSFSPTRPAMCVYGTLRPRRSGL